LGYYNILLDLVILFMLDQLDIQSYS